MNKYFGKEIIGEMPVIHTDHIGSYFYLEDFKFEGESLVEIKSESLNKSQIKLKKKMTKSKFKNWKDVKSNVALKFIKADDIVDIMELGIETEKNVFLFGKGGHGKSEITDEVFKQLGVTPFIQSCGDGLTEEKLFGGLNLKIFQDSGDIFFNVENSFMNSEYVILEEFLDAPMNVLLSLKDILTSGEFRHGSQRFKIKTKCVIALTNRTKAEVSEDDSIKALMERFPLGKLVEWDTYDREDFLKLFQTVKKKEVSNYGKEMQVLANIISTSITNGNFVSPRTAIHCLEVVIASGFESLVFIDGLDSSMVKDTLRDFERIENIAKNEEVINKTYKEFTEIYDRYFEISDFKLRKECITDMKNVIKILSEKSVEDDNVETKTNRLKDMDCRLSEVVENFLT